MQVGGRLAYRGRCVIDGYRGGEVGVFERNDGGHDLGDRGDLGLRVGIAFKINGSVWVHDDCLCGFDIGKLGVGEPALFRRDSADDVRHARFRSGEGGRAKQHAACETQDREKPRHEDAGAMGMARGELE